MLPGARMQRLLVPAAVVLLLGTGLAGCLGDGFSFGSLAPAAWAPGFAWEWGVEMEQEGGFEGPGGTGSGTMRFASTMRDEVLALAQTTDGKNVYVLSSRGGMDPSSDDVRLRVVDKTDLTTLAVAYGDDVECIEEMVLHRVYHGQDLLSLVDFPLEAGAEYTVDWEGMEWTAKVTGQERVEVPAGRFDAVRLEFRAVSSGLVGGGSEPMPQPAEDAAASPTPPEPMPDEYVDEYMFEEQVEGTISIWYAAAAHNVVRAEMEMAYSYTEDEESYSSTQRVLMELASISLDVVEGPTLDPIRLPTDRRDRWIEPPSLRIVSDTAFPMNTATQNATATFWLEAFPRNAAWEEGIPVRDAVVPYTPSGVYEGHTIHWAMRVGHEWLDVPMPGEGVRGNGERFEVEFPLYGDFRVAAWLERPPETRAPREGCSENGMDSVVRILPYSSLWPVAEARAEVHFEEIYSAAQPAGLSQNHELVRFMVPEIIGEAVVEYLVSMHVPLPEDMMGPVFISPSGEEYTVPSGAGVELAEPGEWILEWRGQGQWGSGVSPGYDAEVRLFLHSPWTYL